MSNHLIGIIDDERNIHTTLGAILERRGYRHVAAYTAKQGLAMIGEHRLAVLLLDLGLPDSEGLDFLRKIRSEFPGLPVIVVTANDSLNNAIESIKLGAFHFISKPYVPEELLSLVNQAVTQTALRAETEALREETDLLKKKIRHAEDPEPPPVFKNARMVELAELIDQVAPSEANVLLVGESGVGKEVFANQLHVKSARARGPLVKLNCASFPAQMIEGELFGYKKGAFTGASHDFPGMLNAASGGTLFLDEIAEMPIELQTRFLRVLQEREFRPLGSTQVSRADFRLIAASNRRPDEAIRDGRFRQDLFYRVNTFTFEIPPLRERVEDIPELTQQFVDRFARKMNKAPLVVQPETYELLFQYGWPGNVRELQNVIERAVVLARDGQITPRNLPPELFDPRPSHVPAAMVAAIRRPASSPLPADRGQEPSFNLAEREKSALLAALEKCRGNKKKAAELLGIHRPTLYTKLKKFGLAPSGLPSDGPDGLAAPDPVEERAAS